jgi:hypothetical protein
MVLPLGQTDRSADEIQGGGIAGHQGAGHRAGPLRQRDYGPASGHQGLVVKIVLKQIVVRHDDSVGMNCVDEPARWRA